MAYYIQKTLGRKQRHKHSVLFCYTAVTDISFRTIFLPLSVFFMPFTVIFLCCSRRTIFYGIGICCNDKLSKFEKLGDIIRLPVAYILFYTLFHINTCLFTFNDSKRYSVYQNDYIGASKFTVESFNRKLLGYLPYIFFRMLPIYIGNIKRLCIAVIKMDFTTLSVDQTIIHSFARIHKTLF